MRIRPGILLGEVAMAIGIVLAMLWDFQEVALVLAGGLCSLLPKLVDSEEITERLP